VAPVTPAKPDKAAARDGLLRLFSADWTDALWEQRDPAGKMIRVADGLGERLAGLADFCHALAWADLTKSGRKNADDPMPPGFEAHRYLAQTLGGLSKVLKAAHAGWWAAVQAEDDGVAKRRARA
jgi:hypothetical protein